MSSTVIKKNFFFCPEATIKIFFRLHFIHVAFADKFCKCGFTIASKVSYRETRKMIKNLHPGLKPSSNYRIFNGQVIERKNIIMFSPFLAGILLLKSRW